MKKKYLVKYSVKTNIEMIAEYSFTITNVLINVYDDLTKPGPFDIFLNRLILDVIIESDAIESAISESYDYSGFVATLLSFQLSTEIGSIVFEKALDWSPGIVDREFVHNVKIPVKLGTTRKFNTNEFLETLIGLNRADISHRNRHPERIEQSIRWYHKASCEHDLIPKFTYLWFGLELLNGILADKYESEINNRNCPEIFFKRNGKEEKRAHPGLIYFLLNVIKLKIEEWNIIKEVRNGIVHGHSPLTELISPILLNISKLEKALFFGIYDCLEIPMEKSINIIHEVYQSRSQNEFQFQILLKNSNFEFIKQKLLPEVIVDIGEFNEIIEDLSHKKIVDLRYKIINYDGEPHYGEIIIKTDYDPDINNIKFEVSPK